MLNLEFVVVGAGFKTKFRYIAHYRIVPAKMSLRRHNARQTTGKGFRDRGDSKYRVSINWQLGANLAHAITFGRNNLVFINNSVGCTGDPLLLHLLLEILIKTLHQLSRYLGFSRSRREQQSQYQ